jgi:uncharacterized protein YjbI with pentapeptide repeats
LAIYRVEHGLHHCRLDLPSGQAEVRLEQAAQTVTLHVVGPDEGSGSSWRRCHVDTCLGNAVTRDGACLRHASPRARTEYLSKGIGPAHALSLQGVAVDQALLDEIKSSPAVAGKTMLRPFLLTGADVTNLDFSGWEFAEACSLYGAIFHQKADFEGAVFHGFFDARGAHFDDSVGYFSGSTFKYDVHLSYVHSERQSIDFSSCTFAKGVIAKGLDGPLLLYESSFAGDLILTSTVTTVRLDGASVTGSLDTTGSRYGVFLASWLHADGARSLGPMEIQNGCILTDARFAERIHIEVSAKSLDMTGVRLDKGGRVEADVEEIRLERLSTASAVSISGSKRSEAKPIITSINNADAGAMSFAQVDMSRCLFYGAHDLDRTKIEATVVLPRAPKWRSRRQCVADEFVARVHAHGRFRHRWSLPGVTTTSDSPGASSNDERLEASQVESVYRDLRKSLEARGNEPGAADFYYGEMEMRRKATTSYAERFILWLYWAVSGYGLRGLRALVWLAAVVVGLAVLLQAIGFNNGDPCFRDALIYTAQGTVSIPSSNRALTDHVSWAGEVLRIVLRLVGPILLALALLSVRNRVKR